MTDTRPHPPEDDLLQSGPSDKRIPVILLTGFLGAGKTTFLNRILSSRTGRRFAVIVNEIGEIGIDGDLIVHGDEELRQLANGCICCTVRGDLRDTGGELAALQPPPDAILVESTGLADPGPVAQSFMIDPALVRLARLDRIVTLADAVHLTRQIVRSPEASRQIAFADAILLTRADQCGSGTRDDAIAAIAAINPEAPLRVAQGNAEDLDIVLAPLHRLSTHRAPQTPHVHGPECGHDCGRDCSGDHHHHRSDVSTLALRGGELDHRRFLTWIQAMTATDSERLWRIKGILAFAGDPHRYQLQGVHMLLEGASGTAWGHDAPRESRLVVIGRDLDGGRLRLGWESCAAEFQLLETTRIPLSEEESIRHGA